MTPPTTYGLRAARTPERSSSSGCALEISPTCFIPLLTSTSPTAPARIIRARTRIVFRDMLLLQTAVSDQLDSPLFDCPPDLRAEQCLQLSSPARASCFGIRMAVNLVRACCEAAQYVQPGVFVHPVGAEQAVDSLCPDKSTAGETDPRPAANEVEDAGQRRLPERPDAHFATVCPPVIRRDADTAAAILLGE